MTGGFPAEYGNRFGGVDRHRDPVRIPNGRIAARLTVSAGEAGRRRAGGDVGGTPRAFRIFRRSDPASNRTAFSVRRIPSPFTTSARGGHVFVQFEAARDVLGADQGRRDGRRDTTSRFPETAVDVDLAAAGQRPAGHRPADRDRRLDGGVARRGRHGLGLPAMVAGAAVPRRRPADGRRRKASARSSTLGGKIDATRFIGRHALKAGIDVGRLRPTREPGLRLRRLSRVHAPARPAAHALERASRSRSTARKRAARSAPTVQDNIQAGRVTARCRPARGSLRPDRLGHAREPARECRRSG